MRVANRAAATLVDHAQGSACLFKCAGYLPRTFLVECRALFQIRPYWSHVPAPTYVAHCKSSPNGNRCPAPAPNATLWHGLCATAAASLAKIVPAGAQLFGRRRPPSKASRDIRSVARHRSAGSSPLDQTAWPQPRPHGGRLASAFRPKVDGRRSWRSKDLHATIPLAINSALPCDCRPGKTAPLCR